MEILLEDYLTEKRVSVSKPNENETILQWQLRISSEFDEPDIIYYPNGKKTFKYAFYHINDSGGKRLNSMYEKDLLARDVIDFDKTIYKSLRLFDQKNNRLYHGNLETDIKLDINCNFCKEKLKNDFLIYKCMHPIHNYCAEICELLLNDICHECKMKSLPPKTTHKSN